MTQMAIYTGYNIVFIYVLDKYSLGPEAKTRWVLEKKNYFGNKIKSQIHNLLPSDGREGQVQMPTTVHHINWLIYQACASF